MNEIDALGGLAMHNSWVMLAGAAILWLAWMARWRPCRCADCPRHTREREDAQRLKEKKDHDYAHKGDQLQGSPDRFDCADIKCPRNRMNIPPK
jgi:hypothetical protein